MFLSTPGYPYTPLNPTVKIPGQGFVERRTTEPHPFWETLAMAGPMDRMLHRIFYTGNLQAAAGENLEPMPRGSFNDVRMDYANKLQGNVHLTTAAYSTNARDRNHLRGNFTQEKLRIHSPFSSWYSDEVEKIANVYGPEKALVFNASRKYGLPL